VSEDDTRNVVALGEMKRKRAELFEPRLARNDPGATGEDILSEWDTPVQLPPLRLFLDAGLRRHDAGTHDG